MVVQSLQVSGNLLRMNHVSRPVRQVAGIRKSYGKTVPVDDGSFDLSDGEMFGLVDPNGAGKTTAPGQFAQALGIDDPASGERRNTRAKKSFVHAQSRIGGL